jgi:hypothetical protein
MTCAAITISKEISLLLVKITLMPKLLVYNLCSYNALFALDNLLKYLKLGEIDMIFSISGVSALQMGEKLGSSASRVAF